VSSTGDNVVSSQLLVDMPAQSAARLLTLSLLEQLPQNASVLASPDARDVSRYIAAYRSVVRRLRACLALYADAFGDGVPRKARRRLRAVSDAAERLYRADVQLAWCARHAPGPGHVETVGLLGDGARTSIWLGDRVGRRRDRAVRLLQRVQGDSRPLRRIAKRLGVYTTAVRLDAVTPQQSFARMTGEQLVATARALGAAITRSGPTFLKPPCGVRCDPRNVLRTSSTRSARTPISKSRASACTNYSLCSST